jgi:hypothetical protein
MGYLFDESRQHIENRFVILFQATESGSCKPTGELRREPYRTASSHFGRRFPSTPPGVPPKCKNEPEKCFRMNKTVKNEPENEPERTRAKRTAEHASPLESEFRLNLAEEETETNLRTNPTRMRVSPTGLVVVWAKKRRIAWSRRRERGKVRRCYSKRRRSPPRVLPQSRERSRRFDAASEDRHFPAGLPL